MQILALSRSLRAGSSNTAVLDAARHLAPPGVAWATYDGLRALPSFDPDLDPVDDDAGDAAGQARRLPAAVVALRAAVGRADALLISSPEYAHGIAGAFKNLLDWLVGSTEFPGTPVTVLNPSPHSTHAPGQLCEVLRTMNARLVPDAPVVVPLAGRWLDAGAIAADPTMGAVVRDALAGLLEVARGTARVAVTVSAPVS